MGRYYILRIYLISVLSRTLNCRKKWPKKQKNTTSFSCFVQSADFLPYGFQSRITKSAASRFFTLLTELLEACMPVYSVKWDTLSIACLLKPTPSTFRFFKPKIRFMAVGFFSIPLILLTHTRYNENLLNILVKCNCPTVPKNLTISTAATVYIMSKA